MLAAPQEAVKSGAAAPQRCGNADNNILKNSNFLGQAARQAGIV